jgi:hypothetical protein
MPLDGRETIAAGDVRDYIYPLVRPRRENVERVIQRRVMVRFREG